MASGLDNQLARQIGEHLVTAKLGRMGILATPFAGNVPDIDLLAHANQRSAPVQVKAINITNSDSWQFDIRRFLKVEVINGKQKIFCINEDLDRSLICVFVRLGEDEADDEFYIFRQGFLQDHFVRTFKGRNPPRKVNSFHCAIRTKDISRHRDKWSIFKRKFKT